MVTGLLNGLSAGSDSDAEEGQEGLSSLEAARRWVVEQLAGACSLSGVTPETQRAAALYLTTQAFFELDASQVRTDPAFLSRCGRDGLF